MTSKQLPKKKASYPGVRFREHPTRRYNGKLDRYFFIRYRRQGKLKEEGVGWASENWNAIKASQELAKLKESIRLGQGPQSLAEKRNLLQEKRDAEKAEKDRQEQENVTFSHIFYNIYFPQAENNKDKESCRREQDLIKGWISPEIGDLPLKDISPFHLERIKKTMSDAGLAARTIRYALAVIRQVFNFSRFNNIYSGVAPTTKVKMPQADNRRLRFLTHEEADQLMKTLALKNCQLFEMALMSLHCGLRAGEIFPLTWGDIDLDKGMMILKDTKSGRNRTAFMTEPVKNMLAAKIQGENDDLIFFDRDGGQIKTVSRTFEKVVKDLGFNTGVTDPRQKVVFHTLRHTYASWLVESGVDLYTVKNLLGHSTIAMTERYSHLGNNTLQNAVKVFEGGLKEKSEADSINIAKKGKS